MYLYNDKDKAIVQSRVDEFEDQVARRMSGELSEDMFRPLRLMNGLYLQRHAYMLRVAIPYGLLSSKQVRALAEIADKYDQGYGHITTRQNIQYNWPKLRDAPAILQKLADVEMHAIQTSGNCIRNTTSDPLAGVAKDEVVDPRPYAEALRQWSTFHPEFAYLPRKFKIAITGATEDRAAILAHDIGLRVVEKEGQVGFEYYVGGGLGRTPILGSLINEFLPAKELLRYTEAVLRVYNQWGNRENKYKARIKILVRKLGPAEFGKLVDTEWAEVKNERPLLSDKEIENFKQYFTEPNYETLPDVAAKELSDNKSFATWYNQNTRPHRKNGYRAVYLSLKRPGQAPGDVTSEQLRNIADLADRYSFGETRTTHEQNLVLADVKESELFALWADLRKYSFATANLYTLTDMICCPGLDYCALANAGSIEVADNITKHFDDEEKNLELGDIHLKMSGCINACGHHHVGHIGILGVNKKGKEFYQIMLGGSAGNDGSLGEWIGPAFSKDDVHLALERILDRYREIKEDGERFLDTYRRVGRAPFKEAAYV